MAPPDAGPRQHLGAPPAGRRGAIDVARSLALLVVVLGHLLLAVIDRPHGAVRGANLLALHPGWVGVAALAPMPVFFVAAGWANATATLTASAPRLRVLVGLGATVVTAWSATVIAAVVITGDAGVVGDGARIATQPLWFVAAYAPLAAAGAPLARLARRHLRLAVGVCVGLLALLDAIRFGADGPEWLGWPGFYLAWGTPWLVGAWWRGRWAGDGIDERRVGVGLVAAAGTGCVALVALAGYDPALIDAVRGARSNTTPPTLYTAVAALAQVGLLLVVAPTLDRAATRGRRLWERAGEVAVGVYAWHLSALALCAAAIAAGLPVPERLTTLWWATRPLWWAAVLVVTGSFVAATAAAARTRLARRSAGSRRAPSPGQATLGVAVAAAGGAAVGLRGPRSASLAAMCAALFLGAWLLLRERGRRPAPRP